MGELKKRGCNTVGFIDPYIVFKITITQKTWLEDTRANIRKFLETQRDKRVILFPYVFK